MAKIASSLLALILLVVSTVYFVTLLVQNSLDISMKDVYESKYPNSVWLISFADGDIHKANQNYLNSHNINKGFDFILSYNKKHIASDYYKKHEEILSQKRGAGYWLWKPYFIKQTLDLMKDGDILFYIDSGSLLDSDADFFIDKIYESKDDIVLFENRYLNKPYIKRDLYGLMDMDEKYSTYHQLDASVVILRKSARSVDFINKWLAYCENKHFITDSPSVKEEFEDFIDHRHDQSILTLLYYKNPDGILLLDRKDYEIGSKFFHHRRRNFDYSLLERDNLRKMLAICGWSFVHLFLSK